MMKKNPGEYIQQVRQETSKVTWPTRKETAMTTMMVFIMVTCFSLFFLGVDSIISFVVRLMLGFGG